MHILAAVNSLYIVFFVFEIDEQFYMESYDLHVDKYDDISES